MTSKEEYSQYSHLRHTALAVSTEVPPTCCLNLLFASDDLLEESGEDSRQMMGSINAQYRINKDYFGLGTM